MLQVGGYAGLALAREGMLALREVFDSEPTLDPRPVQKIDDIDPKLREEDRLSRGKAILAILQPTQAHVPLVAEPFAPDWTTWLISTAFGELWARPGLSLIDRERVTISVLVVLGHELRVNHHVQSALNVGIPAIEIGEQIMHLANYVGFPTIVEGMRIAGQVLLNGAETAPLGT
jgi:4-carboxymuconolactone decarboxylase